MILTCPDCATNYEVDGALIPVEGREVRCSACLSIWHTNHNTSLHSDQGPATTNLSQLEISARDVSSDRTPGRDYSYTSGAYFARPVVRPATRPAARPATRGAAAARQIETLEPEMDEPELEMDMSVRAALFDLEETDRGDLRQDMFERQDSVNLEEDDERVTVVQAVLGDDAEHDPVESKWTNVRDAIESLARQKTTFEPSQQDVLSDQEKPEENVIEDIDLATGTIEADQLNADAPLAAQIVSPFHAELDALQSALLTAGLTIAPLTNVATENAERADVETGLEPYQSSGDIITVEGDVTADQLARQYTETKKSASHFVKASQRLISLFWRYTPPIFKKNAKSGDARGDQALILPELSHVTNFRKKVRQKARNKITPLRALGWLVWAGSVASMAFVFILYKEKIVEHLPGSATFYSMAGFATPVTPLELDDVAHRYAMSPQGAVVEITGAMRNTSSRTILAPQVEAQALGRNGAVLETWIIDVPVSQISPQMETTFLARAKAPEGIEKIKLSAVVPEEGVARVTRFEAPGTEGNFFIQNTMGSGWPAPEGVVTPPGNELLVTE